MIQVQIPNLQDPALYQVLRQMSFLAVQYSDIIKVGTQANRPTTGRRCFYYATDTKTWYAYCGDATVGDAGWIMFG
jgi:hypothetical protein